MIVWKLNCYNSLVLSSNIAPHKYMIFDKDNSKKEIFKYNPLWGWEKTRTDVFSIISNPVWIRKGWPDRRITNEIQ